MPHVRKGTARPFASLRERVTQVYECYYNLRLLPLQHSSEEVDQGPAQPRKVFIVQKLKECLSLAALQWSMNLGLFLALYALSATKPSDFGPSHETLALPLFSSRRLLARLLVSFSFLAMPYTGISSWHADSAVLFTLFAGPGSARLAGADQQAWSTSPVFGDPREAYSMRRLWGVFWHRLAYAPYMAWKPRCVGRGGSGTARMAWLFAFSAAYHAFLSWHLTEDMESVWRECKFWALQFGACAAETVVVHALRGMMGWVSPTVLRCVGYVWVAGVMAAITLSVMYPGYVRAFELVAPKKQVLMFA